MTYRFALYISCYKQNMSIGKFQSFHICSYAVYVVSSFSKVLLVEYATFTLVFFKIFVMALVSLPMYVLNTVYSKKCVHGTNKTQWSKFTYIGKETRAITKMLKNTRVKVAYSTNNTLEKLLT